MFFGKDSFRGFFMATTASFLQKLQTLGIDVRSENGKLVCDAPKGVMTPEIANAIKLKKSEILAFLKRDQIDTWSSLVPIQPQGSQPPFFCFHGAGGNVLNYSAFIPHLGPDQPIYGLQARGLDGISPPLDRIEPMAVYYLDQIKTVQPHGPYYLGGGCMGGLLALETAQLLHKEGEKTGLLAMFDTMGPHEEASTGGRLLHRIRSHNINELFTYARGKIRGSKENREKMAVCLEYQKNKEPIPHELRFWFIETINFQAIEAYQPTLFDGVITILKGPDETGGIRSDPNRGWQGLATKGLDIYEIPGAHDELVEDPLLGRQLAKCLKQSRKPE